MTITEFLLARIAEDEENVGIPTWYCTDSARGEGWGSRGESCPICGAYMFDGTESATEDAWHQHMNDEHGRALRECEAKRRIVETRPYGWEEYADNDDALRQWEHTCRILASIYSYHPDYDPQWAVG